MHIHSILNFHSMIQFYLEVSFYSLFPTKEQPWIEEFLQNFISSRDGPVESRDENTRKITLRTQKMKTRMLYPRCRVAFLSFFSPLL